MILARGKNGKLGRKIPGVGDQARVVEAQMGDRRGSVNVSYGSIEADQAYYGQQEANARAKAQALKLQKIAKRNADEIRIRKNQARLKPFQALSGYSHENELLRRHFSRKKSMGETETAVEGLVGQAPHPSAPADFSSAGANPEYVYGESMPGGKQWRADFRQHRIVGNPLTRDGEFGPMVTDYDRILSGRDVNEDNVVDMPVAGGTMLGRMSGGNIKLSKRAGIAGPMGHAGMNGPMGFDFSWDGITDALSDVAGGTVDNVVDSLPDQLAKQLQQAVTGGGKVSTSGNVINVTRPVTGTVTTISKTLGLPTWAVYTGAAVIGAGFLLVMIKAVKA